MSNTKYYTPKIEEFHIGFECERVNQELLGNSITRKIEYKAFYQEERELNPDDFFKSYLITPVDINYYFLNPLHLKELRVKHLDKYDIESRGWRFIKISSATTSHYFEKENYRLDFDSECSERWNLRIYTGNHPDYEATEFSGFVKNKNEFGRLLKQLNIE